ncbi:hypothetical protein HZA57_00695, partial [Candidatus Poribacteria bacterium]|nr:hypothetical protein [Candidatus Poribacteria bacterium]
FGFQGLPSEDCLREITPDTSKRLNDPAIEAHQKEEDGNSRMFRYMTASCRPPESFEELVYLSQWTQAEALSGAVLEWRARKPETMGALVWHFNDCWPALSCSLVDYRRRPKLAYWAIRQAFQPIALLLLPTRDGFRTVAVHDGPQSEEPRELVCRLKSFRLDGQLLEWKDSAIRLGPGETVEAGRHLLRSLGLSQPGDGVITGELLDGKNVLAAQMFCPVEARKCAFEAPKLECLLDCLVAGRRAVYLVRSANIVRGVELRLAGMPRARIRHENGFDIWPGREVWVQVDLPPGTSREEARKAIEFRCLNDAMPGRTIQWRSLDTGEGEGRATGADFDEPTLLIKLKTQDLVPKLKEGQSGRKT